MKKPIKPLAELLDSVRNIEGFPIGKDEDILALSNPPYYTACPNPYIKDFIEEYGKKYDEETDDYKREPYVGDVSVGKNNAVYNAHPYHTKVPHEAIENYIKHYSAPGDIVLDAFCGTGMAGIAAQQLNRKAILIDLSTIAALISSCYNKTYPNNNFENEANRILSEVEEQYSWLYKTKHINGEDGEIDNIVWSDVLISPYSNQEFVFFNAAVDIENGKVKKEFKCPHTGGTLNKKECAKAFTTYFDEFLNENIKQIKQVPVYIEYKYCGKTYNKTIDKEDLLLVDKILRFKIPHWIPICRMPEGDEARRNDKCGITHVHHFYSKRNLIILSAIFDKCDSNLLKIWFTSQLVNLSKMNRYRPSVSFPYNPLSGTLYISSLICESNVFTAYKNKIKKFVSAIKYFKSDNFVSTQSASATLLPENTIDYIFTDPPFGYNIMYSELSFLWESWLKVFTNTQNEAIINKTQKKELLDYSKLMTDSFREYYRVLKPNRWITVEFHNSQSSVWNTIQDAMLKAGFIIANVAVLDKGLPSFKQITAAGAVQNDLVISAYKPKSSFTRQFLEMAGEGLEEEFIHMHLSHLKPEPSIERTEQMLYSKMLAYYVQRSYTVKYDASTFYKMLRNKFTEKDGYWFNSNQLPAYQEYKQKMKLEGIDEISKGMLSLFVSDEKSALIWLHAFLDTPKDFQTIHPAFHKVASITGDKVPDLREILNDNFIREGDTYRRPQSEDEKLTVNQKRERELIREFEAILLEAKSSKKKIKEVRKQSLVYGFEQCYKANRFGDILAVSRRLDSSILENNADITEFIEVAEMKTEGF